MTPKPDESMSPDARWQSMVGTYQGLVEYAALWPRHTAVEPEVGEMLQTCRALFAHSYFVYEFGPVAVVWSVLAVERALRDRLGEEATQADGLTRLIGKAQGRGWFTRELADGLRAGAELRNRFTHGRMYGVFTPAMVAGALPETAHRAVVLLYETDDGQLDSSAT